MKNKKTIMCISALMILIFHLWVNITTNINETLIRQAFVIGVDMFFFVSAYSISKRKIEYKGFILNRFLDIYIKFVLLTIIYIIYKGKTIEEFLFTISGIDLFISGGGSFMWFIPAIMIMYVVLPLYKIVDEKYKVITPIIIMLIYLITAIGLSLYTNETAIFILLNRIPIILIGYYIGKYKIIEKMNCNKLIYFLILILLLVLGIYLTKNYCLNYFSVKWLYDIKYLLYIPLILGIILLLDKIKANTIIKSIGNITLELYGFQMIYGFKLANILFKQTRSAIVTNLSVIVILIVISFIFYYVFDFFKKLIKNSFMRTEKRVISK